MGQLCLHTFWGNLMRAHGLLSALALSAVLALTSCSTATPPPVSDKVQKYYDDNIAGRKATLPAVTPAPTNLVAFIGDSYTAGAGSTAGAWPDRMVPRVRWNHKNFALGGTGYVQESSNQGCGLDVCPNYLGVLSNVVKVSPAIVVVAGGRNDSLLDAGVVSSGVESFYQQLRASLPDAKIVALSPVWDASEPPASLADIASSVKRSVTSVGGVYLDIGQPLSGHPELLAADKVHPNDAGHEALAIATEKALRATGVVKP